MKRKILIMGVLTLGLLSINKINASALESVSEKCYSQYTEEQIKYILEQSDPKDLDLTCANDTIFSKEKILNDENLNKDVPTPFYFTNELNVTAYKQEKSYGCGYASVKEVLQNINGTSKSQSQYESEMGNAGSSAVVYKIRNILNNYISGAKYTYTLGNTYSLDSFKSMVVNSITNKRPVIMHSISNSLPLYKRSSAKVYHYYVIDGYSYNAFGAGEYMFYVDSFSRDFGDGNTFGKHRATGKEAFDSVNISGRYVIHA